MQYLTARRMAGSNVYHINAPGWISHGRALCGFDTTNAGFTTARIGRLERPGSEGGELPIAALEKVVALHGRRVCGHCSRKATQA